MSMHHHDGDRPEIPPDAPVILEEFSLEVTIPWSLREPGGTDQLLAQVAREVLAWLPSLQAAVHAHNPHVEVRVSPFTPWVYEATE
jgi:hypothetical protein